MFGLSPSSFRTGWSHGLGWTKSDLQNDHRVFGFSAGDLLWLISGIALVGVVALIATA